MINTLDRSFNWLIRFLFYLDPYLVANALDFDFGARYERSNCRSWLVIDGWNCLCGLCSPWFLSARQCDGSALSITDQVEAHQKINWASSTMETHTWLTTVELVYLVVVLMGLIQLAGVLSSRFRLSKLKRRKNWSSAAKISTSCFDQVASIPWHCQVHWLGKVNTVFSNFIVVLPSAETSSTDAGDLFVIQWLHLLLALLCAYSFRGDQAPTTARKKSLRHHPQGTQQHFATCSWRGRSNPELSTHCYGLSMGIPLFFSLLLLWHG